MCENKASFIRNIFLLSHDSQAILKELVEHVLSRAIDLEESNGEISIEEIDDEDPSTPSLQNKGTKGVSSEEDQLRSKEMIEHLQNERQSLLDEIQSLSKQNDSFKQQIYQLSHEKETQLTLESTNHSRSEATESMLLSLQKEVDEYKRDLDIKLVENENLKADINNVLHKLEITNELKAKLEMENHEQADELELARDRMTKLIKAEQTIEKYTKKLEEMMDIKKQNKEFSDKLDQYLDRINDLESTNKSLVTTARSIENYKNRAIELEREKMELISTNQIQEQQYQILQQEYKQKHDLYKQKDEELFTLQTQFDLLHERSQQSSSFSSYSNNNNTNITSNNNNQNESVFDNIDSVPMLKEKIKQLERALSSAQNNKNNNDVSQNNPDSDNTSATKDQINSLQMELDLSREMRKQSEEAYYSTKKQVAELQHELTKLQEQQQDQFHSNELTQTMKENQQKLAASTNTVKLLEERLKEKETIINKLEQEKSKLESYTRRSLTGFKEKFMSAFQKTKEEKQELENKYLLLNEKYMEYQERWKREEKLLSSSLFEVGLKIMDRKIQYQLHDPIAVSQNSFLGNQRDAMQKSSLDMRSPNNTNNNNSNNALFSPGTPLAK